MPLLLPVHVTAAAVGLLAGAVALAAPKGGALHRRGGMVFFYAMLAMCGSATVAAVVKGQGTNVVAALMTAYLVLTGWATVQPRSDALRRRERELMGVGVLLGAGMMAASFAARFSPGGRLFGYPPFPFFLFGVLGLSAGAGDWRMLRSAPLRGAPRLARHLWRMCMALFIAAASFFSIRARVAAIFPAPLATPFARLVPVLLVLLTMGYWLWRIRSRVIPLRA